MFIHPLVDGPAIIKLGPIILPVYGFAYFLSYIIFEYLGNDRLSKRPFLTADEFLDLLIYLLSTTIVGARLMDILFYRLHLFLINPWIGMENRVTGYNALIILFIVSLRHFIEKFFFHTKPSCSIFIFPILLCLTGDSGMSFHGGVIAALLSIRVYSYRFKKNYLELLDFIAPLVPSGIALGRLANFINGELWGRPTTMPWGVIFPQVDFQIRHPSQLYECFLEGIMLFIILWNFSKQKKPKGAVFGLAITLYAIFRITVEFFREPNDIGFIAWEWLTMGQLLSLPMLIGGIGLLLNAYLFNKKTTT